MELAVRNVEGEKVKSLEVDDKVFGLAPHHAVIHQTLLAQLANRRAGGAHTKTRSEVRGSTAKQYRQKGTGRARMGSISSPTLRGGGVAFGPRRRSFAQRLPNRMRRLALRSLLSAKAAEGSLSVLDALKIDAPRTKDVLRVLQNLGLERSTLIVTAEPDRTVLISSRNLPGTKVLPAAYLNVVDMLSCRNLVMTVDAVRRVEELWGGERVQSMKRGSRGVGRVATPPVAEAAAAPETEEAAPAAVEAVEEPAEAEATPAAVEAVEEPAEAEKAAPAPKKRSRAAGAKAAKTDEPAAATARRRSTTRAKATGTTKPRAKKPPKVEEEKAPAEESDEK